MSEHMPHVLLWSHRLAAPLAGATGIGRYSAELVRALAKRSPSRVQLELGSCAEALSPTWVPDSIPIRRAAGPRRAVHLAWMIASWPPSDRASPRPDLVHALSPSFPVPSRGPVVYTFHDLMPLTNPSWFGRVEREGFRRAVRHARRRASAIVVPSQFVKDLVVARAGIPPDRLHVVHSGITGAFARPPSPAIVAEVCARHRLEPATYIVAVGSVSERKNLGVLVDALLELDGVVLVLAGPDRGAGAGLLARAAELGVAGRVRLLGFVADADLPALVAGAAAMAHPSLDEGFGFTPLEAMAVGTAVVVSASGSLPEVVGDAAIVVAGSAPEAWAAALRQVTGDEVVAARLRERGRTHAAAFSWDRTAAATEAVWATVLDG